jgi:hypothetical protein
MLEELVLAAAPPLDACPDVVKEWRIHGKQNAAGQRAAPLQVLLTILPVLVGDTSWAGA